MTKIAIEASTGALMAAARAIAVAMESLMADTTRHVTSLSQADIARDRARYIELGEISIAVGQYAAVGDGYFGRQFDDAIEGATAAAQRRHARGNAV